MTSSGGPAAVPLDVRDRVLAVVDDMEGELVDLAAQLVRIPSVAPNYPGVDNDSDHVRGGEAACNRLLADVMSGFGCDVATVEVEDGRPNVVGVQAGSGGAGGRSLVLNGHVDVVPYGRLEDWERDPVSGEVADGRI